ncbi:MAG TPA: hypothetical protein VHT96_08950 [Clostridia bacterium]|nr:hypothetical protein [Clostridia bacterium]
MITKVNKSGSYVQKKDDFIKLEGTKVLSFDLLLQGKIDVYISPLKKGCPASFEDLKSKSYRLFELDQNIFIGVNDLLQNSTNTLTVTASSDCSLYAYACDNTADALNAINSQKDYGAYVINSLCNLISNMSQANQKALAYLTRINSVLQNLCVYYAALSEEYSLGSVPGKVAQDGARLMSVMKSENIMIPVHFNKQFIEALRPSDETDSCDNSSDPLDSEYFIHLFGMQPEIRKSFFGADQYIAEINMTKASACLGQLVARLSRKLARLDETIRLLYGEDKCSVYEVFLAAAREMNSSGLDCSPAANALNYIYDKLREISAYMEFEYRHSCGIDFKYLEHYHANAVEALSGLTEKAATGALSEEAGIVQTLPEELKGSAEKILEYSEISEEKATCFMMNLVAFRNLKNRLSADESARAIRTAISDLFFEIYPAVFKKAYLNKDDSRLIKMFLMYGYMDEKLLDNSQTIALYKLAGAERTSGIPNIHHMDEWFARIYDMERDPSVNSFGSDYFDTFRELKKQGKYTDKDKPNYDKDRDGRLDFENKNMFCQNHRLCQGQISVYFPILHRDMAPHNPVRSLVTPEKIKDRLDKILEVDFSAFHREIHFRDAEKGIEKEIVMMQVLPDIILVPVYGTRAMMWQEISGRVRSTPGRFLVPVFTDENLDDMLLKLVGNFRWELCRTMMGAAWNDISQSSLTSEYADFIQFYRKNHDLSDDAKEKVKASITKNHNRLRDIFTSDYEIWINNESKGNPRLNKVARSLLLKHCPFAKAIRSQLEQQPIYTEMLMAVKFQRQKQARELENHYKYYLKANGEIDPTLQKNLEFYRDM